MPRRCRLALVLALAAAGPAGAVPSFQRLYQACYGVEVASCLVCHARAAGGKLNDYGRAFVRAGAGWEALEALAGEDPDGDGASTAQEAKAGSNPGDAASTPAHPGRWLAKVSLEDTVPVDELAELFPDAARFEVKDIELTDGDAKRIADRLGSPLSKADRYVTLYFPVAERDGKPVRTGVALFAAEPTPWGVLLTAVALGPDGRVRQARGSVYSTLGRDSLKSLARQIAGKTSDDPIEIGKDLTAIRGKREISEAAARAFRRSLLAIACLLGR
jgi:hypothetical protein